MQTATSSNFVCSAAVATNDRFFTNHYQWTMRLAAQQLRALAPDTELELLSEIIIIIRTASVSEALQTDLL